MKYTKQQLGKYRLIEFRKRESRDYPIEDYITLKNSSCPNMVRHGRKYKVNKMIDDTTGLYTRVTRIL